VTGPTAHGCPDVGAAVAAAHAQHWAVVVAAAARTCSGDLGVAEEAAQDAFVAALETWGERGVPANPAGWLVRTAQRRVLDGLRRASTLRRALPRLAVPEGSVEEDEEGVTVVDDRLRLVLICCHPALAMESRLALTLRMAGGLSTAEIASAFLVSEPTMAARITRAKRKIVAAHIPYRVPRDAELPERLDGVLSVLHLMFTTGHTAPAGEVLQRRELADDALDLARMLAVVAPDEPEVLGLLALLQLTHARRTARQRPDGTLVLLEHQDRGRWDRELVTAGLETLHVANRRLGPTRPPGRYLLQAGIAAAHADATTFDATDWRSIVRLYDRLLLAWPSPVVRLNRLVAVAYLEGPEAGLRELDALDAPQLARYHYLPAARGEMLSRLGRNDEAADAFALAVSLTTNKAEQRHLRQRIHATGTSVQNL
jgi:RNA polymerase sigma-70 factor (ECF subfamily)